MSKTLIDQTMTTPPNVYTIPAWTSFLDALAKGILSAHARQDDPLALADVTVLVPTRRAARTLADAFSRASGHNGTLILPRIRPIGDVEEDELILGTSVEEGFVEQPAAIPEPISNMRRQILLAQLIQKWGERERQAGYALGPDKVATALPYARELARFLDMAQTEEVDLSRLHDVVPDRFTEHWQEVLRFVTLLTDVWPSVLAAEGAIDPAIHRNEMLNALAAYWHQSRPLRPIVAAGSTGSIPATARLLKVVAQLPNGAVILPGLDVDLDAQAWTELDEQHPQFAMKTLLETLDMDRSGVALWPGLASGEIPADRSARSRLITEALRPANSTHNWHKAVLQFKEENWDQGLATLSRIETETEHEEALVIAVIMREAIDHPTRTVALVTPDRKLARRVSVQLRRWDIFVDDSAGVPLSHSAEGSFLALIADFLTDLRSAPLLLSILKHPLCRMGLPRETVRQMASQLELEVFRAKRPPGSIFSLSAELSKQNEDGQQSDQGALRYDQSLIDFVSRIETCFAPAQSIGANATLTGFVECQSEIAEKLADSPNEEGATIWEDETGEAVASLLGQLLLHGRDLPPMSIQEYATFFKQLVSEQIVRKSYGAHPRLFIWGPLEARLQQPDLTILGALNEGVWPLQPAMDPWISRPMRKEIGMSLPERKVGLSAHDFSQLAASNEVILTRAKKEQGTPTIKSRWLMRLEAVLKGAEVDHELDDAEQYLTWARQLDASTSGTPAEPPAPRPPIEARPKSFTVSEISTWIRDPYAIYAKKILCLHPILPLDAEPDAAEFGSLVHELMRQLVERVPRENLTTEQGKQELIDISNELLEAFRSWPALRERWQRRVTAMFPWVLDWHAHQASQVIERKPEVRGRAEFGGTTHGLALTTRADLLDRSATGYLIYDYKTGTPPSESQVKQFLEPQLPLEGLILKEGGFEEIPPAEVDLMAYIRLSADEKKSGETYVARGKDEVGELVERARAGLVKWADAFACQETPYLSRPRVMFKTLGQDYDHLARVKEWSSGFDDADGA